MPHRCHDDAEKAGVVTDAKLHPWPLRAVARGYQQCLGIGEHVMCGLAGEHAREVEGQHLVILIKDIHAALAQVAES